MARKPKATKPSQTPKTVLLLPDLDQAKSAVPNSLSSADASNCQPEEAVWSAYESLAIGDFTFALL